MLSIEQKNKNILNRFESKEGGSKIRVFKLHFEGGKSCTLVCMNGQTIDDAFESGCLRFGKKFKKVTDEQGRFKDRLV